jgi:hypothetical protein
MVFREFIKYILKIPHRNCLSHHQFYPLLEHDHSEQCPLSFMYDILSLTNSTLLTADMIPLCTTKPVPNSGFHSPFHRKMCAGSVLLHSHLTSCTPTKCNLYLDSSLKTVTREPALSKLLRFHVPNLMLIFCCLGRLSKESVQVRGPL